MTTKVCEKCDQEMKLVPAGFSRSKNRPYNAFWSCDKRSNGCGGTAPAEGEAAAAGPDHSLLQTVERKLDELTEMVRQLAA